MLKKLLIAGAAGLGCILLWLYYHYNPAVSNFFPQCPFYHLTGLNCPGCGSQRAIYQLLHGHWLKALHYNALMVCSLPFLGINAGYYINALLKRNKAYRGWPLVYKPATAWIILIVVVSFWVLRNIPVYPLSWLKA